MPETTEMQLETIIARAAAAALPWADFPPRERARALVAAANALNSAEDELVAIAMKETGLGAARLSGELARTSVQLRLFADVVVAGHHLDVRIDEEDPQFVLGRRPDVRRFRVPVGPVLNFAASNFPFAFSVAGGDTASALAAGNPVIVKAHSGHPLLSERTSAVVASAMEASGAPVGTVQLIFGQASGVTALRDSRIAAASFTGSTTVGRMLADVAAARPAPIPFFGELGSVNPVFVTRAALDEDASALAEGFVASVAGSAGQLCTKPGFVFVPSDSGFVAPIPKLADAVPEHRLLTRSIASGFEARRDTILSTPGVQAVTGGSFRWDDSGSAWATPTIVLVGLRDLVRHRDSLLDETFGPLSVIVEYSGEDEMADAAALFEGSLTGTVHSGVGEESSELDRVVSVLARRCGRVLFEGWPTGVAVTHAMQHGGPWPATTNDSSTSVGTASISRFTRPVAFQDAPQSRLPEPLRDDNPWGVPQSRSRAGESVMWGQAR